MAINLIRTDLEFLLEQVTINYLDANGNPAPFNYSALTNALDPRGIREVSGANNNLVGHGDLPGTPNADGVAGPNTAWGQSNQPFLNLSPGQVSTSAPEAAYNQPGTAVSDADPRLISNLVTSMIIDPTHPLYNPAAAAAATNGDPNAVFGGLQVDGTDTAFVANAGVLGGGRYNGWFVAFGQFFDHGLDFVNRDPDPTATITVNLSKNDPLYSLGADNAVGGTGADADVTTITIRRADVSNAGDAGLDGIFGTIDDIGYSAGADGQQGTADDVYAKAKYINQTGLLIDQSQTYGSHASVNALIREYDASGRPTGRVVAGNTLLGQQDGPSDTEFSQGLATWADIKANALRIGVILSDGDIHNAPALRVDPAGKLLFTPDASDLYTTAQISGYDPNSQDPNDPFERNADGTVKRTGQDMLIDMAQGPGAAPLDAHIITGDGRGNENIGLTAVHHVFHEEHNAQVENIKAAILATADATFIAQWEISPGIWDGEKLYQAARLITESEYNHTAIDQYVGTLYGALPEFVSYSSDINPGVSLEFSQAVFRLGHSMLTETFNVDVPNDPNNPGAGTHKLQLLEAFLNPELYADLGPQALTLGLTNTLGNEVDEFVTPALQQSLLGQPLDLATINIARGRDVGLPTWNEFRQNLFDQYIQNTNNTNSSALAPYTSWADVFDHLKSAGTGVNLIAAYARGDGNTTDGVNPLVDAIVNARNDYQAGGPTTLQDIRVAAQALYDAYLDVGNPNHAEALAFMEGAPTFNETTGQWEFTGADQGFWDIDLWIGGLAERPLFDGPLGTTFSYVILDFAQRQQDGDRFYYLYRTPMGTHLGDEIIRNQFTNLVMENAGLTHLNGEIFIWPNATFELDGTTLTDVDADGNINDYFNAATHTITDVDGTEMQASAGHLVIAGNAGHDYIIAGLGDDTVYGDDGNDTIQGNQGNDHLFGGAGNDLILDDENDDFIDGGSGDDRIFAGAGVLDTVFGGDGNDEIHGGDGIDELLGGAGDDMVYGDGDTDVIFGEEGNDFVDGGDSVDEVWGQDGNDWLRGGVGDDHLNGGAGNDLLEGGIGAAANDGDRLIGSGGLDFGLAAPPDTGMDVASYEDVNIAITADLETSNQNGTGGLIDTYVGIDGLVGSRFDDKLTGAGTDTITQNGFDNLLVGGAGNDTLSGLGGDDEIFGDSVAVTNDLSVWDGISPYSIVANWKGTGEDRPDFGAQGGLGHLLGDNGAAGTADTAIFSGQWSDYTITKEGASTYRIVDTRGIDSTAIGDLVTDVELFQFSDGTRTAAQLINQAPVDIQWNAAVPGGSLPGNGVLANLATVDPDNTAPFTYSSTSPLPAGFSLTSAGVITRTGGNLATNQTYTFNVRTTDAGGKSFDETIRILTGNGSANTLNGNAGDDIIYANGNSDTLNGNAGNDTLFGQSGSDTLDGGAGDDVLNGGSGTDTASYASASSSVTVSLAILTAQDTGSAGTDTLTGIENLTGSASADSLTGDSGSNAIAGGAGIDDINGGAGGDVLIGGDGGDTIDTGASNDNVRDSIRFVAVGEYGDTVNNFDATGTGSQTDRIEFDGALNTAFDDGSTFFNFDTISFVSGNGTATTVNANINPNFGFASNAEALLLTGASGEGVTNANLTSLSAVAAAFNAEFNITANNGADALLVINDTDGNSAAVYQWVQTAGGTTEIDVAELTQIAIINANATVTANHFAFV